MPNNVPRTTAPRRRRLRDVALTGLMLAAAGGMILRLVNDVRTGHGLDYYFTGFGVRMNAIGALTTMGVIALVGIVAPIVAWWRLPRKPD